MEIGGIRRLKVAEGSSDQIRIGVQVSGIGDDHPVQVSRPLKALAPFSHARLFEQSVQSTRSTSVRSRTQSKDPVGEQEGGLHPLSVRTVACDRFVGGSEQANQCDQHFRVPTLLKLGTGTEYILQNVYLGPTRLPQGGTNRESVGMDNVMKLFRLDSKVAMITGGSKGIGRHYVEALVQAGARAVVADIDRAAIEDTVDRMEESYPSQVMGTYLDVTDRRLIAQAVQHVEQRWGGLDILVNNAGLYSALPARQTAWGIPDDEWDRILAVNVRSIYTVTELCLPLLKRGGWGRIINISSGLAIRGSPRLIHYSATKAAVTNLTRTTALAVAGTGITVNSIGPGMIASDTALAARGPEYYRKPVVPQVIDRVGVPGDLVGTLIYLASPAGDFVTGQMILVDGGGIFH